MNILKQQLGLERWQELNGELGHSEYHLYFVIMFQLNKARWEMPYKIPASVLMHKTGIKDKVELKRVRDRLIRKGLIIYADRMYSLVILYDNPNDTEDVTEDVTESDTKVQPNVQPFETSENGVAMRNIEGDGNKSVTEVVTEPVTDVQPNVIPNVSLPQEKEKNQKKKNNINNNININNKRARKTPTVSEVLESVQSDKLREWLTKFVDHRKKMNKPLTGYALQLIMRKLDNLSPDIGLQCEMLQQSILNAWQSVYPLKDDIVYKEAHDNSGGTCLTSTSEISEIERAFMRQYYVEEG